jgi:hypothetical protein
MASRNTEDVYSLWSGPCRIPHSRLIPKTPEVNELSIAEVLARLPFESRGIWSDRNNES